jgi:hypothetical protein
MILLWPKENSTVAKLRSIKALATGAETSLHLKKFDSEVRSLADLFISYNFASRLDYLNPSPLYATHNMKAIIYTSKETPKSGEIHPVSINN